MKYPVTAILRPFAVGLALCSFTALAQTPGDIRIALVIGNSAYTGAPALTNPANDATAMSETLRGLGFTVIEVRDGNKAQMAEAIAKVRDGLQGKQGVGMLYYAGHGLQMDARNYMVPVNAKMAKAGDVAAQTVEVGSVIEAFKSAGNRMNILVLDACRDNPFGGITTGKGLAPLDAPSGTFLAYATAPGNVAADGDAKTGNGLYTQYLLQELKNPKASIENVFKRVRFAVRKASNGKQIPWESTSLEDDFQFNDGKVVAIAKPTIPQLQAEFSQEKPDWDRIKDSTDPNDFYAFLQKYPNGTITEVAHARLNVLTKPQMIVQGAGSDGGDTAYTPPRFRLGDEFVEREVLVGGENAPAQLNHRVSLVTDSEITVDLKVDLGSNRAPVPFTLRFTPDGARKGSQMARTEPALGYVPDGILQIGQRWQIAYQAYTGVGTLVVTGEGRILGRERVTVPAGTFEAFKVLHAITMTGNRTNTCTLWVSSKLPIPVKRECRWTGMTETRPTVNELVSYTHAS